MTNISDALRRTFNAARLDIRNGRAAPIVRPAHEALTIARKRLADDRRGYADSPWRKPFAATYRDDKPAFGAVIPAHVQGDNFLRWSWNVGPETGRLYRSSSEFSGYYTRPDGDCYTDGTGLVWGVVYRLPGRKGRNRYLAGYQFGGMDAGPTLDLGRIFDNEGHAGRAADQMAHAASQAELAYQTAFEAGRKAAGIAARAKRNREALKALLRERRALKPARVQAPAICEAVADRCRNLWAEVRAASARIARLAAGDNSDLYFFPDDTTRAAYAEGFDEFEGQE